MYLFRSIFSPESPDYVVVPFSEFFEKFNGLYTAQPHPAENPLCYYAQFFQSGIVTQPVAQSYYAGKGNKSCYVLLAINPANKCQQTLLGFAFLTFGTMETGISFANIDHLEFVYDVSAQSPVLYALFLKGLFSNNSLLSCITGSISSDYYYSVLSRLGFKYTSFDSFSLSRTDFFMEFKVFKSGY